MPVFTGTRGTRRCGDPAPRPPFSQFFLPASPRHTLRRQDDRYLFRNQNEIDFACDAIDTARGRLHAQEDLICFSLV
jgi:hypothetical protein